MNSDTPSQFFPPTRWTLISRAASADEGTARRALADICKIYRAPVYRLMRRYVRHEQDAEDLTHEFFQKLIESNFFAKAEQPRGRLSNLLWTSARRFLRDQHASADTQKRGGGRSVASLDAMHEGNPSAHDPVDDMTPDRVWQLDWALALLASVKQQLAAEYSRLGKAREFALLQPFLPQSSVPEPPRGEVAASLKIEAKELAVLIFRLRQRLNDCIIAAVRETLEDDCLENVRQEVAELLHYFRGDLPVFEKDPRNGQSPPADSV